LDNTTILLVDDEAVQRNLMRQALQAEGYHVLESADYEEALVVHERHLGDIDLLLIDLRLPGGNGYELSRTMLTLEPHLKVLFISGHAGSALCKFFEMEVTDVHFLQKPFLAQDLVDRVRSVLETAGLPNVIRRRNVS